MPTIYRYTLKEFTQAMPHPATDAKCVALHAAVSGVAAARGAAVRPIFRADVNERLRSLGSAVRLSVDGRSFLLSAAHVLRNAQSEPLYIGGRSTIEPLGGTVRVTPLPPSGDPEDDPVDVAVMELDQTTATALADRPALSPADLDVDDRSVPGDIYSTIGNPYSATSTFGRAHHVRSDLIVATGRAVEHKWYPHKHFKANPLTHVLVEHNPDRCYDLEGQHRSKKLSGASGGAVFRIADPEKNNGRSAVRCVGVFLSAHRDPIKVLIDLKTVALVATLNSFWPELRGHLPKSHVVRIGVNRVSV